MSGEQERHQQAKECSGKFENRLSELLASWYKLLVGQFQQRRALCEMVACQIDLSAAPILSPSPATRRLNLKQRSANRPEPACKVLHKLFTVICFSSGNSFGVGNSCSLFSRIVRSRRRHRGDKEYADESNRPGNTARPNYSFQAGNRLWMLKYS